MIRMFFVGIFLFLYFTLGLIPMGIYWLIGRFNKRACDRMSLATVNWGFRTILFISGVKLTVKGRENIPDDTPVLYVSNHQSIFDVLVGYPNVKGLCGFVAKVGVKKVPILRRWMQLLYCLFMDRDDIRQSLEVILKGADQIKGGVSMWICPEGTRNKTPDEVLTAEFKEGSLKMAERAKAPVVPVAITGTRHIFEEKFPRIRPGRVTVEFGKPFLISELPKEQKKASGEYARNIINEMLKQHKNA